MLPASPSLYQIPHAVTEPVSPELRRWGHRARCRGPRLGRLRVPTPRSSPSTQALRPTRRGPSAQGRWSECLGQKPAAEKHQWHNWDTKIWGGRVRLNGHFRRPIRRTLAGHQHRTTNSRARCRGPRLGRLRHAAELAVHSGIATDTPRQCAGPWPPIAWDTKIERRYTFSNQQVEPLTVH